MPGKSHGWRSLVGCSPWGCRELDTEQLHFHFSLSCIGEGNGNPLQCSCLENPRDRGAWWAVISEVAQSRTRLKRLSSSSSSQEIVKDTEDRCATVLGVSKSQTRLSSFTFTFHFPALEKDMATHSSVLAWRIPGTGEPGGLPSMGLHRVGHDLSDLAAAAG